MTRYRDSVTGKLVSESTWKRSHAHGGTRYVRESRPLTRESTAPTARAKRLSRRAASDKREKRKPSTRGTKIAATPSRRKPTARKAAKAVPRAIRRKGTAKRGGRAKAQRGKSLRKRELGQFSRKRKYPRKRVRKPSSTKKRTRRPQKQPVMTLVTVDVKYKKGIGLAGHFFTHGRFRRDLLIPAPRGSTLAELRAIAEQTLSPHEKFLADFIRRGATVAEGPRTKARKAQVR